MIVTKTYNLKEDICNIYNVTQGLVSRLHKELLQINKIQVTHWEKRDKNLKIHGKEKPNHKS